MNQTEQLYINTLNKWVNVKLAPSDIDGIGVFAIRDIKEGDRLFLDIMGEVFHLKHKRLKNQLPEDIYNTLVGRWPLIEQDSPFVFPDARYVAYMNHSDDPNYDAKTDLALRDIKKGEEVTEDYRKIKGWENIYKFLM